MTSVWVRQLTMRNILGAILFFLTSNCFATGQIGELIIYDGDTLTMLSEPLEVHLQKNEPREKIFPMLKDGCSTALWRGYVGLWELKNDSLMLIDIFACGHKSTSIKNKIFKGQDTAIFADWFNGQLFIEKGKVIKYNHMAYDRCYEQEIVVDINKGLVEKQTEYKNGVKPNDNRFSRDIYRINEEIYRRIDWNKLPKLSRDKRIFATLTLDNGKLTAEDSVIEKQPIEDIYKLEIKRVIASFPDIQVFYSRGQPLKEGYYGAIIFSRQNKRKYARK